MKKIVAATANAGKLKEIKEILRGVEVASMRELGFDADIEESGSTFLENALIKAHAVASALGLPALADDSGLEVDALGGAPGIYSARYSGAHATDAANNQKLLAELERANPGHRAARFVSAVALVFPDGRAVTGQGCVNGEILLTQRGTSGFGYDPLFYSPELKKTFGEAAAEEKNAVSHRRRALEDLLQKLRNSGFIE